MVNVQYVHEHPSVPIINAFRGCLKVILMKYTTLNHMMCPLCLDYAGSPSIVVITDCAPQKRWCVDDKLVPRA